MHLLGVGLAYGWEPLKTRLGYHIQKLQEIWLQVIAHNYCYSGNLLLKIII
jgi:hypothetical protein